MVMIRYQYRAVRQDGRSEHGVIEHEDRAAASAALTARGLFPLSIDQREGKTTSIRRMPSRDVAIGLRTLATLLSSGLPIDRALATLEEMAPDRLRAAVPVMRERIRQGRSLADAFEESDVGLPPIIIGIVRAGEAGGGIAPAISSAADLAEASAKLRGQVRAALAYPALLACVGTASIIVIVGIVLPRLAAIIGDVGGSIPPLALLVMRAASAGKRLVIPAIAGAIPMAFLWRHAMSRSDGRETMARFLLALPIIGRVRLLAASTRACSSLAALLAAGVPMAAAVKHGAAASGDAEIARRILVARERVIGGARLSDALTECRAASSTATRLIRAGEDSGRLAIMLDRAAQLDREQLAVGLSTAARMVEPALIIAFASIIAVVAGALLQTVYAVRPG